MQNAVPVEVVFRTVPVRAAVPPVDPLAPVSYGGRSWAGPYSGLSYPLPAGFGGYYGNPDAFGGW